MKPIFSLSVFISFLFLLGGCGQKEESFLVKKAPFVSAITLSKQVFTPTLSVSGTLAPESQVRVGAEMTGTLSQVLVKEGDTIYAGQVLAFFSASKSTAKSDAAFAEIHFSNAQHLLDLTIKQARVSEEAAKVRLENAQSLLKNAAKSHLSTGNSVNAQKAAAKSGIALAQISLENAKKQKEELLSTLQTEERTLQENKKNTIAAAFVSFRKALLDADSLMGFTPKRKAENDAFDIFLGFYDAQSKIDAIHELMLTWGEFSQLEKKYNTEGVESISSEEMMLLADDIRQALQMVDIVLGNSATSAAFPQNTLDAHRTATAANRISTENIIQSLTAITQQISTFETQKPQRLRAAKIAIQKSAEQLAQSEKQLAQITSGGALSTIGSENQISSAKNGVKTASAQLAITKQQNEIAIQQARLQLESARNQSQNAAIRQDTLRVIAPTNGILLKKNVETGDNINAGAPLFTIANIKTLLLKTDISAADALKLSLGQKIPLMVDGEIPVDGRLSFIAPAADPITRRINIEISIINTQKIPAFLFASAKITLQNNKNISRILIPQTAILSRENPSVFVLQKPKDEQKKYAANEWNIRRRRIVLGERNGNFVEVREGLLTGEKILSEPVLGLLENDVVRLRSIVLDDEKDDRHFSQERFLFGGSVPEGSIFFLVNGKEVNDFVPEEKHFSYLLDTNSGKVRLGENKLTLSFLNAKRELLEERMLSVFWEPNDAKNEAPKTPKKNSELSPTNKEQKAPENPLSRLPKKSTKHFLQFPKNNTRFQKTPISFFGFAPENTAFIKINAYRLTSFVAGHHSFRYTADPKYKNLHPGKNNYTIQFFSREGKEITRENIDIFWDATPMHITL